MICCTPMASPFGSGMFGQPLGADEPWFHRHPALGVTVAIAGPIVLGLAILALASATSKTRARS